jgi:CBS domain-containing protein
VRAVDAASRDVVTVERGATLRSAAQLMSRHDIGALPVLADGRLVGLLSEADLLPLLRPDPRLHLRAAAPEQPLPSTVAEAMSGDVVALPADADLAVAAEVMWSRRVRHVPLVEGERVVAILSRRDVLRLLARDDEEVRRAVEETLAEGEDLWGRTGVTVEDGHVTLTPEDGEARSEPARRAALGVAGVVDVGIGGSHSGPER